MSVSESPVATEADFHEEKASFALPVTAGEVQAIETMLKPVAGLALGEVKAFVAANKDAILGDITAEGGVLIEEGKTFIESRLPADNAIEKLLAARVKPAVDSGAQAMAAGLKSESASLEAYVESWLGKLEANLGA